jgi:hypothetical protein
MNEPTILDYLKSLFNKDNRQSFNSQIAQNDNEKKENDLPSVNPSRKIKQKRIFLLIGLLFALCSQFLLEPPQKSIMFAVIFYCFAIVLFMLGTTNNIKNLEDNGNYEKENLSKLFIKLKFFVPSFMLLILAFTLFGNNQFTFINLFFWIAGMILFILSVWQFDKKNKESQKSPKVFFIFAFIGIVSAIFFRFYMLNRVPGEMFSDHAEKLLDVMDILDGKTPIFFIRNTGREAFQFYLTAAIIKIFNTGISFISLKIGTSFLGLITLPFIYLIGKELFNQWVGLIAAFFAGIAYWPDVISRVGLRFPLYPLFAAIVLYFLFKGLQERNYNQLLLAGLFLGLGLHGYSPMRIVPVLIFIIFLIFLINEKSGEDRIFALKGFFLLAFSSLIVFLPLLRYLLENPTIFNYRALTRLTSLENPIQGSIFPIFLSNLWKSLIMFFYKNGEVWVDSIPNRPALDVIGAVFYLYGLLYIFIRSIRSRSWQDFSLLISIPILMLPSILSLAFPRENPALNRSGGAIVPVFIIVGVGFYNFFITLYNKDKNKISKYLGACFAILLISISMIQNYDLIFNQYATQFLGHAWNTSEIGNVIKNFVQKGYNPENAFVVPFPHWVDTRLVGINAGFPRTDYALWPDKFESTLARPGEKIFILNPQDRNSLDKLKSLYPLAEEEFYYSRTPGKNFIIVSANN